jgi:hypothetical protein
VDHGTPGHGGWPRAALLVLPAFRLAAPNGVTWQGEQLELRLDLPWPERLRLAAAGPQALLLADRRLSFAAARLTGSVPLRAALFPPEGDLHAEDLRVDAPEGPLTLRDAALRFGLSPSGTLTLDLVLTDLVYPLLPTVLGPEVQRLATRVSTRPMPPVPVARRLAHWRAMDGQLTVQDLDLRWGTLQLSGSAELRLDAALQPIGSATLALAGLPETLRAATAAGLLTPSAANGISIVAALMQRPGAAGEQPRVHLPLTLEDRRLTVAGFNLLRLPPLRWVAE